MTTLGRQTVLRLLRRAVVARSQSVGVRRRLLKLEATGWYRWWFRSAAVLDEMHELERQYTDQQSNSAAQQGQRVVARWLQKGSHENPFP